MIVSDWPTTLPQSVLESGYGKEKGDTYIESEMSAGPPKRRRVSTTSNDIHKMSFRITRDQYLTLDNFYDDTLNGGVGSFRFIDPMTLTTKVFEFASKPQYVPGGGIYFLVSFQCRELYAES